METNQSDALLDETGTVGDFPDVIDDPEVVVVTFVPLGFVPPEFVLTVVGDVPPLVETVFPPGVVGAVPSV